MDTVWFLKLIGIFSSSFVLNYLLVKFIKIIPILDIPNGRSTHLHATPRSGGIAIFFSFCLSSFLFTTEQGSLFLIPLFLVFVMGLWDDMFSLSSKQKLAMTFVAGMILFVCGFDIQRFGIFLGHEVVFPFNIALCFCAFAIAGFSNAVNLIDGLDGLASVVSIAILLAFAYIGFKFNDAFLWYMTTSIISILCGFLCFNWHPAKIFMGDSGSFVLGFLISMVAIYAIQKEYITAISILLLAAIPILDTLIVMLRRTLQGKNPLSADRTHMHHLILEQQQGNVVKTVLIIGLLQAFFSYIGLGFKVRDDIIIFVLYLLCFVIFYFLLTPTKENQ
ncbi:MAG: MraY family glycosyltransferase [Sulfurospirillaceae bacterium]|nr:MraY family glycosyltransferase [Sulfurospirillaceae bacterium]